MTIPQNPTEHIVPFLPSTYNIPEEEDRFKVFLVDRFSTFADVINNKKIGVYTQGRSTQNGENWLYKTTNTNRPGWQAISYIPSYPNNSTLTLTRTSVPQFPIYDILPNFVITMSYGTASKPNSSAGSGDGDYFTFMNKGDSRISYTMSDTTIVITTTTDLRAYSGFIVVHFLRNGV